MLTDFFLTDDPVPESVRKSEDAKTKFERGYMKI